MSTKGLKNICEVWKDVPGYEGMYSVSSLGRVKSLSRITLKDGRPYQEIREKILKPWPDTGGYLQVGLCNNGKTRPFGVHRLVARTFMENPSNKKTVNHKNGNKADNRVVNLEWATQGENNSHAHQTGLIRARRGEAHPKSKFTWEQVLEVRQKYSTGETLAELARQYGAHSVTILNIVKFKTWKTPK